MIRQGPSSVGSTVGSAGGATVGAGVWAQAASARAAAANRASRVWKDLLFMGSLLLSEVLNGLDRTLILLLHSPFLLAALVNTPQACRSRMTTGATPEHQYQDGHDIRDRA